MKIPTSLSSLMLLSSQALVLAYGGRTLGITLSPLLAKRDSSYSGTTYWLNWGQDTSENNLAYYCQNTDAGVFVIQYLDQFGVGQSLGLSIAGYSTYLPGTSLLDAPSIGDDINTCHSLNKKVILAIGGPGGSYGFNGPSDVQAVFEQMNNAFGPGSGDARPFGDVQLDGYQFDLENPTTLRKRDTDNLERRLIAGDGTTIMDYKLRCSKLYLDLTTLQFVNFLAAPTSFTIVNSPGCDLVDAIRTVWSIYNEKPISISSSDLSVMSSLASSFTSDQLALIGVSDDTTAVPRATASPTTSSTSSMGSTGSTGSTSSISPMSSTVSTSSTSISSSAGGTTSSGSSNTATTSTHGTSNTLGSGLTSTTKQGPSSNTSGFSSVLASDTTGTAPSSSQTVSAQTSLSSTSMISTSSLIVSSTFEYPSTGTSGASAANSGVAPSSRLAPAFETQTGDIFTVTCAGPTTFTQGEKIYTITAPTTLTITSCSVECTRDEIAADSVFSTILTTYCPEPTTFTYGGETYTVTSATTLTITSCPSGCTRTHSSTLSTVATTVWSTICTEPTTFIACSSTYTVTGPTTVTVTWRPEVSGVPTASTSTLFATRTTPTATSIPCTLITSTSILALPSSDAPTIAAPSFTESTASTNNSEGRVKISSIDDATPSKKPEESLIASSATTSSTATSASTPPLVAATTAANTAANTIVPSVQTGPGLQTISPVVNGSNLRVKLNLSTLLIALCLAA